MIDGPSIIDLLVYIETVIKGRRVFLDFRKNFNEFSFDTLDPEALQYLKNSNALAETPIERLQIMNPAAIQLYRDNGININTEYLEIAVCAQHNNGGLACNLWWEPENIKHFSPSGRLPVPMELNVQVVPH